MTPGPYNFDEQMRGNTFNGFAIGVNVKIAGITTPVDFTDADILIQCRKNPGTEVKLEWSTEDGSITISGAGNNIINMGTKTGEEMDIEAAIYKYDINVLLANGVTNTYVKGNFPIIDSISRREL